jgi:hypothetical protein
VTQYGHSPKGFLFFEKRLLCQLARPGLIAFAVISGPLSELMCPFKISRSPFDDKNVWSEFIPF